MRTELVDCDLCGSSEYEVVWDKPERKKKGILSSRVMEVDGVMYNGVNVRCTNCGLVYIRERVVQQDMDKYYEDIYRTIYETNNKVETQHAMDAMSYLGSLGIKPCKSLDIGCSMGILVDQFKLNNFDSYGIDASPACIKDAIELGLNVKNATIDNYAESGFGLITILNTLEHLHKPKESLAKIRNMLTDDGKLFISVPNLYNLNFKTTAGGFLSNMHLYTFDPHSLKKYLEVVGFKTLDMCIVDEFNMQKVYVYAEKADSKPLEILKKPIAGRMKQRMEATDFLLMDTKNFMEGL